MTLKQGMYHRKQAFKNLREAAKKEREGKRAEADILRAWSAGHFRKAAEYLYLAPQEFREKFPATAALWK